MLHGQGCIEQKDEGLGRGRERGRERDTESVMGELGISEGVRGRKRGGQG